MKKYIIYCMTALLLLAACSPLEKTDPYGKDLCTLKVQASYPEEYASFARAGVDVTVEDINRGGSWVKGTDASGSVTFTLPKGLYRVGMSDIAESDIFNGTADKVVVATSETSVALKLQHSKAGAIIIKEIYCGGCKRLPLEGDYQADQYVILHNNDFRVQYLDGLCFGTLFPYNANANNPFTSRNAAGEVEYPDFAPVAQCVWQFPGSGSDFPLQPGEDAILVLRGAIDHSAQYPLSVNLDRPDCFVCYNNTYFTNTSYHPVPGPNTSPDRIMEVVVKTGIANAYTFSLNSPTAIIFRAQGMSMREFVQTEGAVLQVPGSSVDQVTAVPLDWIVDAVEVFNGASSSNTKRLVPSLDAGYVTLSDTYQGHTLMRRTDSAQSEAAGYEVLIDTNNSSVDFYEREKQSLHR